MLPPKSSAQIEKAYSQTPRWKYHCPNLHVHHSLDRRLIVCIHTSNVLRDAVVLSAGALEVTELRLELVETHAKTPEHALI